MTGLLVGKCRSCDAPVSYFARNCPHCFASNQPNPVAMLTVLAGVIFVGASIALGMQAFRGGASPPAQQGAGGAATKSTADADADYGWIVTAMAECEVIAKHKPDTMHFLIVPVTATGVLLPGWSPKPISTIGNAAALLTATDAMIGLRNQMLALYQKPLTFAISDPATQTVYKWEPATGVSSLTKPDTGLASLTLGFEIPDVAKNIEWGPTINVSKGTCYWINPVIRAGSSSG
jgi:hypothetical protein